MPSSFKRSHPCPVMTHSCPMSHVTERMVHFQLHLCSFVPTAVIFIITENVKQWRTSHVYDLTIYNAHLRSPVPTSSSPSPRRMLSQIRSNTTTYHIFKHYYTFTAPWFSYIWKAVVDHIVGGPMKTPHSFDHIPVTRFIYIFLPSNCIFCERTLTYIN